MRASEPSRLDNFDRHVWQLVGAAMGVVLTLIGGWPTALGWLIAWGVGGLVFYGVITGRIVVRRKRHPSGEVK